jgi:uncharacterized protein (TIGR02284 family)
MTLETKSSLAPETLTELQSLIQVNIDSRDSLKEAADLVQDAVVEVTLRDLADHRNDQISELRMLVAANDEEPECSGSMLGTLHRKWMDLRSALGGGPVAILSEAERGEDYIKSKYESVLKQCAGSAVTDVLNRQYASVKVSHDRVRALRDSRKS